MNSSNTPADTPTDNSVSAEATPASATDLPAEPDASMMEYYELQQNLLKLSLFLTGIIFIFVWIFYSLNIALNYFIGACTGVVYLRMLARNVAQLGRGRRRLSNSRLALLIGVIVLASRLRSLEILPIFLGFLTYKVAVISYMVKTSFMPTPE